MHHFFTTESTAPPAISALWYSVMVLFVVTAIMMSLRYYQNEQFRKCFQYLQGFQLICLYLWYFAYHIPWSNSLPFYHCRLAMFAVLFLPDRWKSKQFFALMGVSGAIFALGYPVFDPYTFPHITSFSFLLGHYCLLVELCKSRPYIAYHIQSVKSLAHNFLAFQPASHIVETDTFAIELNESFPTYPLCHVVFALGYITCF